MTVQPEPDQPEAATRPERAPRRRRRLGSIFVLVLVAVGAMVVRTGWLARRVERTLREQIQQRTGLLVTVGHVGFGWRRLAVEIDNVVLTRRGFAPLAVLDQVAVRPAFSALFGGKVEIASLSIDGGRIDLEFRNGQLLNGPITPSSQGPARPPELPFRDLAVSDLQLRVHDPAVGTLALDSVDLDVRNVDGSRLLLGVLAQGGSISNARCLAGRIHRVEARAEIARWRRLRVALGRIETEHGEVHVRSADVPLDPTNGLALDGPIAFDAGLSGFLPSLTCPLTLPAAAPHPHGRVALDLEGRIDPRGLLDPATRSVQLRGRVHATDLSLAIPFTDAVGRYGLGDSIDLRFELGPDRVTVTSLDAQYAGGRVVSPGAHPERPVVVTFGDLARPTIAGHVDVHGLLLHHLVQELGVTQFAKVLWTIDASVDLEGELWRFGLPVDLAHPAFLMRIRAETRDFAILREFHMRLPQVAVLGIPRASISGQIAIDSETVRFQRLAGVFGMDNRSRVHVDSIQIRTSHDDARPDLYVENAHGEDVNLVDIGHIAGFPIAGTAAFTAQGGGTFADPVITGEAHLRDFHYNTLPLGDYDTRASAPWRFRNLRVDLAAVDGRAGRSTFVARNAYLDFSRWVLQAGTQIASDNFYLRDYYRMFKFEGDPLWELYGGQTMPRCSSSTRGAIPCVDPSDPYEHDPRRVAVPSGTTTGHIEANVSFVLGRPGDDPEGVMDVDFRGRNLYVTGFDEPLSHFDTHYQYTWLHRSRGYHGARQNIEFARGRYAGGYVEASGNIDLGGQMHLLGAVRDVSLARTVMLHGSGVAGVLSASGVLEGWPDAQRWNIDADIRSLTAAERNFGDVAMHVHSRPETTRSNEPGARPPRNIWSLDAQALAGAMRVNGSLVVPWRALTWRDVDGVAHPDYDRDWAHSLVSGHADLRRAIDLLPVLPARIVARMGTDAAARLQASVDIERAQLGDLPHANARVTVSSLALGAQGLTFGLTDGESVSACMRGGAFWIDPAAAVSYAPCEHVPDALTGRIRVVRASAEIPSARIAGPEGTELRLSGGGTVEGRLAVVVDGRVDLERLASLVPGTTSAHGIGTFAVQINGTQDHPRFAGTLELHAGSIALSALPDPVEDIDLRTRFDGADIVLDQATARIGSGTVELSGGVVHIADRTIERVDVPIRVRGLAMTPMPGAEVALNADTRLNWNPGEELPLFSGDVSLTRVRYTRPINLSQDQSGETHVAGSETGGGEYVPGSDHVRLNIRVHALEAIRVNNNLVDAEIRIAENERPFQVTGTDQRVGILGTLVVPRGRVIVPLFRGTDFEINRGRVEFDDPEHIRPQFDLNAQTDVRRGGTEVSRNQWRVALHAYGTPERFSLDMNSEPSLSREDIVLLLTFGATRAELDQAGAGNIGQAIAVQALATATGLDRTVRDAIPVIDDFRIGSAYSPSQGRTVPQVAVGRRINDRVRVGATMNTTERREMRATVDVRVTDHTSVQLGYDNINDQGSSQVGNLGADLRWRLEFE